MDPSWISDKRFALPDGDGCTDKHPTPDKLPKI